MKAGRIVKRDEYSDAASWLKEFRGVALRRRLSVGYSSGIFIPENRSRRWGSSLSEVCVQGTYYYPDGSISNRHRVRWNRDWNVVDESEIPDPLYIDVTGMDFDVRVFDDRIVVGCQTVKKKNTLNLIRHIAEEWGYELVKIKK